MARFLSLDWDQNQLHLVAATVGGGAVRVQRAAVWQEEQSPNPADAEALGKLLKERLASAGVAPAPLLACVGRERVILKEVRYPVVPSAEEPAIVRFQAAKELTEAADEVIIDYVPIGDAASGERRALVLIVRRELLMAYQNLCKAAGLKLAGLAPRPFGSIACLRHVAGTTVLTPAPEPADAAVAVLTVSDRWAEFCVARGDTLLFARSVNVGPGLAGEVRRNLAVYAGQAPQQPVRALYLAGSGDQAVLRERLLDLLGIPVHPLDPFAGDDRPELPAGHRGSFSGAVGLLHLQGERKPLPINFLQPREPKPPRDPNKLRALIAAGVAAVLLLGAGLYGYAQVAALDRELEDKTAEKASLDRQLVVLEEDAKRIKAIGDWSDHEVVWIDELYDLTARVNDPDSLRIIQLTGDPATTTGKDKHVAKMTIKGITTDDPTAVNHLQNEIVKDGHYRVGPKQSGRNTGVDTRQFREQFTLNGIEIEKLPPDKYTRKLAEAPGEDERQRGRGTRGRTRGGNQAGGGMGADFGMGGF